MNNKKLIPLEENFMEDKKLYDGVWGFFQMNSYKDKEGNTIVYKTKDTTPTGIFNSIKRIVEYKNGKPKYNISLSTVKRNIDLYKRLGLIWEGKTTDLYGNEVDCYFLQNEFKYYELIPYDTLRFLLNSTNGVVIKIYVYLLNKYKWKGNGYQFTKKELGECVGYTNNKNTNTMIDDILLNLKNNGLINWVEYWDTTKDGKPTPKHKLTFVGTTVKGMEKVVEREKEFKF